MPGLQRSRKRTTRRDRRTKPAGVSTRHRKAGPPTPPSLPPADLYWLPNSGLWQAQPEQVRRAVEDLLAAAYQRLVVEAPDELERSAAITLIHLMWLEICDQVRIAEMPFDRQSIVAILHDPEAMIAKHLQLVSAKNETAELLVKIRTMREMLQQNAEARLAARIPALCLPAAANAAMTPLEADGYCPVPSAEEAAPTNLSVISVNQGTAAPNDPNVGIG